jgi:xylulokinase
MSLICFKNGSLARERIKDACGIDWKAFDEEAVKQTEPGNRGNLLLPYFVPEITPLILDATVHRTGEPDFVAGNMKFPTLVRAIFESQALSMKIHSAWIGDFAKVRVTGGASRSAGFCQVLADVFQADIEKIAVSDSAGLGAALRAAQATGQGSWEELFAKFAATSEAIRPRKELRPIYENASARYREFERSIARHA